MSSDALPALLDAAHNLALPETAVDTVEALRALQRLGMAVEAKSFELAAHVADLYATVEPGEVPVVGAEALRRFGGDGTPEVAEFATLELAAALGRRVAEASSLLADALDVRHRLPQLWRSVLTGQRPVWQARRIASHSRVLDRDAAGLLDAHLARIAEGMSWARLERTVQAWVLENQSFEEPELARQAARRARNVWISQSAAGASDVAAVLDAPDAIHLDAMLDRLAHILAEGGVKGNHAQRRAQALGVLATPARALQLLQASIQHELPTTAEETEQLCRRDGQPGHTCGTITVNPDDLLPTGKLVLHLTDQTLVDGAGLVRGNRLHPLLAQWLPDLLGHHRITVRPVIDANHLAPSDAYECPPTMREAIQLRNAYEVFPWSTRSSDGLDLDHTAPYQSHHGTHAPQTHPGNLGPLTRAVHRAKTHAGWHVEQPVAGIYWWRSPLGYEYLVTRSRTIDLGRPERREPAAPELTAARAGRSAGP